MARFAMARLAACAVLTGLFPHVSGVGLAFIDPPTHGTDGGLGNNPTYNECHMMSIEWLSGDDSGPFDLVLHQVRPSGLDQGENTGEFIMPTPTNDAAYLWTVIADKSLTMSSLFFLSLVSNAAQPDFSQYFHVERDGVRESGSSSSSIVSSPSSSLEASTTTTPPIPASIGMRIPSPTSTPTSDTTNTPSARTRAQSTNTPTNSTEAASNLPGQQVRERDNNFPLGAKIGLGVGIPVALVLGLVSGWLLYRRHQQKKNVSHELPVNETAQDKSSKDGNHASRVIYEAPSNQIVELGRPHGQVLQQWGGELENKPVDSLVRYEMDVDSPSVLCNRDVGHGEPCTKTET